MNSVHEDLLIAVHCLLVTFPFPDSSKGKLPADAIYIILEELRKKGESF